MNNIYFSIALLLALTTNAQNVNINVGDKLEDNNLVTAVSCDGEYTWAATTNGIYKVSNKTKKSVYYSTANSPLQSNNVTSVCCRANGDVWIGTPKGIVFFDGYTFNTVDTENSILPENNITGMKEDANNDLWIGTSKSGLVKVHRNRFYIYNTVSQNAKRHSLRETFFRFTNKSLYLTMTIKTKN